MFLLIGLIIKSSFVQIQNDEIELEKFEKHILEKEAYENEQEELEDCILGNELNQVVETIKGIIVKSGLNQKMNQTSKHIQVCN